jgi:hypothetical protein
MRIVIVFTIITCVLFTACTKYLPRNFYQDPNNQGLSVFTSRSYNIMSMYIDSVPYVNPYICSCQIFSQTWYNSPVSILAKHTAATLDTLYISWQIADSDHASIPLPYNYLTLLMPVQKGFSQRDFMALNGQRFVLDSTNGIQAVLSVAYGIPPNGNPYYNGSTYQNVVGPAAVYFTQVQSNANDSLNTYQFSGLFEGNPGNTLHITKGRFDFQVPASSLNF